MPFCRSLNPARWNQSQRFVPSSAGLDVCSRVRHTFDRNRTLPRHQALLGSLHVTYPSIRKKKGGRSIEKAQSMDHVRIQSPLLQENMYVIYTPRTRPHHPRSLFDNSASSQPSQPIPSHASCPVPSYPIPTQHPSPRTPLPAYPSTQRHLPSAHQPKGICPFSILIPIHALEENIL